MKHAGDAMPTWLGWDLIVLLASITAFDAMAVDMYLPAFPSVAATFGSSSAGIQQSLSIFLIGAGLGQGVYGPLLDRFGRRWPLLIGVGLFLLGSVMAATASSLTVFLAARFLQAAGAAAGAVAPRAIIADRCDSHGSAKIFAIMMQVMMIAPILAPVIGAYLVTHADWRAVFWALAGAAAVSMGVGLRLIPETLDPARRRPLDLGSILRAYGRQLGNVSFMSYTLAGGFIFGSLFVYINASPFVFIQHYKMTPVHFSYFFAANAIGFVVVGQISIWLLKHLHEKRILWLGILLHTLGAVGLWMALDRGMMALETYLVLLGLSIWMLGLTFGSITALTMAESGDQAGVASALMGMLQYLMGAAIGSAVSLCAPGLKTLPAALILCGLCAGMCCWAAMRQSVRSGAAPLLS